MTKIEIFGFCLLMLLFVQCENRTLIEYNLGEGSDEYIVTGAITLDSKKSWVQIQNKIPALGDLSAESEPVDELIVSLYANYDFVTDFERTDSGYYFLPEDFKVQNDLMYSIHIYDESDELIKSSMQLIPDKIDIDSVSYNVVEWDYMMYKYNVNFYLADPIQKSNYYRYDHYEFYNQQEEPRLEKLLPGGYIFSDSLFNGEITDFQFYANATMKGNKLDSILILLYTFSTDLYSLSESMLNYDGSIQDSFSDFPSPIFSNIENAYGVFGAYNVDTFMVVIPNEFLNDSMN